MMYLLFFLASSAKCLAVGPSFVLAVIFTTAAFGPSWLVYR